MRFLTAPHSIALWCCFSFFSLPPPCIQTATKLSRLQNWTFVQFSLWSSCTKRDWPDWAVFSSQLLDQACSLLGRAWETKCEKNIWKIKIPHFLFSFKNSTEKNEPREKRKINVLGKSAPTVSFTFHIVVVIIVSARVFNPDLSGLSITLMITQDSSVCRSLSTQWTHLLKHIFVSTAQAWNFHERTRDFDSALFCIVSRWRVWIFLCWIAVERRSVMNKSEQTSGYLSPCVPPHRMLACPSSHPQILTHKHTHAISSLNHHPNNFHNKISIFPD